MKCPMNNCKGNLVWNKSQDYQAFTDGPYWKKYTCTKCDSHFQHTEENE